MTIPDTTETLSDGSLGFGAEPTDKLMVVVGPSSAGVAKTVYPFADPSLVDDAVGYGTGPEAVAHHLNVRGGLIYFVKAATTTAGASSAVTKSGSGPEVTISVGVAFDNFVGQAKITGAGTRGTATFQYTLDGGDTWSPDIATGATFPIPNSGLTLAFASGTYVLGETYSWTSTGPMMSTTDIGDALDAFAASPYAASLGHIVGCPGGATDADKAAAWAGIVSALQTKAQALFTTNKRDMRFLVDAPDITDDSTGDSAIATAFAAVVAPRVCFPAGFCELQSAVTSGRVFKRPATWPIAARVRSIDVHVDPARFADGPLPNIVRLYHDENLRESLDALRIPTLRTFTGGVTGYYITNCWLGSAAGSDYRYIQDGRLIDQAVALSRPRVRRLLSDAIRTYATPAPSGKVVGEIREEDARSIENDVTEYLKKALVNTNQAEAVRYIVVRGTDNFTSEKLQAKVRVKRFGILKHLETDVGYTT